jgi:dTDP-glucose 4,6-dehydratase
MKLLVTGGAGFIGANFIRHYLEQHPADYVLNLDKLTYAGNLDNLAAVQSSPRYTFCRGDVCDAELVSRLLGEGVSAVVHFAAETHVDRSIADAREFIRTNVQGTHTLLEAARRRRIARFLYVSTDEVYGSLAPGEFATEQYPLRPRNPYAASKAAADLLVQSYWSTYGFPALIARPANNYGPYQFPEKLIPLMITHGLEDRKLPVYGDGLNEHDWVHVEDCCRALAQLLESGRLGEVYNIGSGQVTTNLEIIRKLLRALGRSEALIEFVQDRPGHDRRYALDTSKINQELNWRPLVPLEEGLARTVAWYSQHAAWADKARSGEYQTFYEKFYVHRRDSLARL